MKRVAARGGTHTHDRRGMAAWTGPALWPLGAAWRRRARERGGERARGGRVVCMWKRWWVTSHCHGVVG